MKKKVSTKKKNPGPKTVSKASGWHKKIAMNRGTQWKKNVAAGKLDAATNPTALRIARLKKSIHQEKLAKDHKLAQSTYGAIERAKRTVNKDVAKKIASAVGYPVLKLFKPQGEKMIAIKARQSI